MLELLKNPWPWYVAGPLIGLTVPALLLLGNKSLGISSSLRHVCAACMPANISFFKYDWKNEGWNLVFVMGIFIGGMLATYFLSNGEPIQISSKTQAVLSNMGLSSFDGLMPVELFGVEGIFTLKGMVMLVFGGFLVGFGTRYAGGCTSGHTIMGLSNLQWPSLVASISFMIGGFIMTHLGLPYLLKLIL